MSDLRLRGDSLSFTAAGAGRLARNRALLRPRSGRLDHGHGRAHGQRGRHTTRMERKTHHAWTARRVSRPFGIRRTSGPLRFGIEGEVLLARMDTFEPLWHDQLDFFELVDLLETIPTDDVARDGLRREGPHPSALPYVVEGYDVPAPGNPDVATERLPKGLEIRTPTCSSITRAVELYAILFERLRRALAERGLAAVHVSHHPRATTFAGPRNSRRPDWWRWQMAAMTTYGPT